MASAYILFDNSKTRFTLPNLLAQVDGSIGFVCEMSEWRFHDSVIPQLRIGTEPPIALQLDEDPEIVPAEIHELLDSHGAHLDEVALAEARLCGSWVEIVSGEPRQTQRFLEGGIVSHAPNVDMDSPDVQLALRRVAAILHGWTYDNINGRWI